MTLQVCIYTYRHQQTNELFLYVTYYLGLVYCLKKIYISRFCRVCIQSGTFCFGTCGFAWTVLPKRNKYNGCPFGVGVVASSCSADLTVILVRMYTS